MPEDTENPAPAPIVQTCRGAHDVRPVPEGVGTESAPEMKSVTAGNIPDKRPPERRQGAQERYLCDGHFQKRLSFRCCTINPVGIGRGQEVIRASLVLTQGTDRAVQRNSLFCQQGTHAVLEIPAAHAETDKRCAIKVSSGFQQRGQAAAQHVPVKFVRAQRCT